jgi:hypothetical protein
VPHVINQMFSAFGFQHFLPYLGDFLLGFRGGEYVIVCLIRISGDVGVQLRQCLVVSRLVFEYVQALITLRFRERDVAQFRVIDRICYLYVLPLSRFEVR